MAIVYTLPTLIDIMGVDCRGHVSTCSSETCHCKEGKVFLGCSGSTWGKHLANLTLVSVVAGDISGIHVCAHLRWRIHWQS